MLYFLEKAGKIAAALGSPHLNSRCRQLGALLPDLQVVTLIQFKCNFQVRLKILGIVKITTHYLIVTVNGLPSQALPSPPPPKSKIEF